MSTPRDSTGTPRTRWEDEVDTAWYIARFDSLEHAGADLEGEARFIDAMVPRSAAVLDAGSGTGRTTAALARMGHRAVGVDKDAGLVGHAQSRYPHAGYLASDLLSLTPDDLESVGAPTQFDVIALAGNVLQFVAPGTERDVLARCRDLLLPDGRIVVGFATDRSYPVRQLDADAAHLGLALDARFATWHLHPWHESAGWCVSVFSCGARRSA